MPYKLLLSEEISPAIRRIAIEQLSKARRRLSASDNLHEGVHETRKCLKRLRSLLRLSKPILGRKIFKAETQIYRDLGRSLARPREAGAIVEIIHRLQTREDFHHYTPHFETLLALIIKEKKFLEQELEVIALNSIIESFDEAIDRWKTLTFPEAEFETLAHGFARSYERGRDSLKLAIQRDETFFFHEWRKDVQHCWRHMQMLTLIWPEDIMPRIRLARDISRLLGTEHDLDELMLFVKAHKKDFRSQPELKALRKSFSREVRAIQRDLCLHAVERGRRLYAFHPKALGEAMTIYWKTGQALQPLPLMVRTIEDINELKKIDETSHSSSRSSHPLRQQKSRPLGAKVR